MHISYPTPEPVITPRAREGLRAVVPTIFPPSTVNRGESVRVRPPELAREPQQPGLQHTSYDGLMHIPKKRGPKPKPRFKDSSCGPAVSEPHKRRAEEQMSHSPHKVGGEDMRLVKVAHRHPENHGHSHKHHHHHHYHHHHTHNRGMSGGSSYKQLYSERSLHPHRTDMDTHRTDGSSYLAPAHFKHQSKMSPSLSRPAQLPQMEKPYFLDRPSPTRLVDNLDEVTWRPSLCNVEKVLVTDVTTNFLTVTIKESSTSKGFFKDKR
ncbi:hypothetical protein PAMP_020498 [Pampus punctatissimus]